MRINLNTDWQLTYRDLTVTADKAGSVLAEADFFYAGSLPCDVRMPLIKQGLIQDPVVADYCFASEWVEEKSWWFYKEFNLTEGQLQSHQAARLVLESLDLLATVFLNGQELGQHKSAHYPFSKEVRRWLVTGKNTLLVRLTAGAESVDKSQYEYLAPYTGVEKEAGRGEKARTFLRKPQYVFGWDWAPRVASIGIMKNAWLDFLPELEISSIHPVTLSVRSVAKLRFTVEFNNLLPVSTREVTVTVSVQQDKQDIWQSSRQVLAASGVNYFSLDALIHSPRLWWPAGAGDQPLYTVTALVRSGDQQAKKTVRFGIRTIRLDQNKSKEGGRRFAVRVNGVNIYCKGANWVPADSIYARVSPQKYEALLQEARAANFNMLRVWGGGIYERDEFYQLCDELGIMVWQDLMFACALYPDDQEWFLNLVRQEIDYQTRRLRHHPSLALWCGNNENHWLFQDVLSSGLEVSGGLNIYNQLAPALIRANCPQIPYWRSSPYGGALPNDSTLGDRHHWHDCTMNEDVNKRVTPEEYDKVTARFISEYGYIGPCSTESIAKYHAGHKVEPGSAIWDLHNNTFEKGTVPAGIKKHYSDPEDLALEDYLAYARLVQGLIYGYSLESIRFKLQNNGALFWMYSDAWGEVGWSIVDYYLDRKPAYYHVKRAFAPHKLILRYSYLDRTVRILGANDTAIRLDFTLEYGYAPFDGPASTTKIPVQLLPFQRRILHSFPLPDEDMARGFVFARGGQAALALLRQKAFRELAPAAGEVTLTGWRKEGPDLLVDLASKGYTHAVTLNLPASWRLDDAYFDMLPGDRRTVRIYGGARQLDPARLAPVFLTPEGPDR